MSANEPADDRGPSALASVCKACRGLLVRAVRRLVRWHDVEDMLREAFVRSREVGGRYLIRNPRAFLLRTATHLALGAGRRATTEARITAPPPVRPRTAAPDRFEELCRVVGGLPDRCRRAFILKKVYGLDAREIAAELGITVGDAEQHIATGLVLCREALDGGGQRPLRGWLRRRA